MKPLTVFVFFFALACERVVIETQGTESRCYWSGKYTVCRRVRVSFSPEILQAGAVKGLRQVNCFGADSVALDTATHFRIQMRDTISILLSSSSELNKSSQFTEASLYVGAEQQKGTAQQKRQHSRREKGQQKAQQSRREKGQRKGQQSRREKGQQKRQQSRREKEKRKEQHSRREK